MEGDDFHTSLQQLRLQLDLMNKRTASILDKSHQHPNSVTHNSSQVGQLTSAMADNAQQIKHIGATVGALARQQQDRLETLEHQLNLLSDKLDDLALTNPQFTPSESSASSVHENAEKYLNLPSDQSFYIPRQIHGISSATVADVGGYFYPNYAHYNHSNQHYISDALTFVGRVNRTLRTKSINNIEIFLRGSALRWFHIGLGIDGSHIFDCESGEMNIAKFCQSLILLFGVPKSSRPESDKEAANLASSSMRSIILEDFAFPALESARQQGADPDFDVVLSKVIKRYNRSSTPFTMDFNNLKNKDLLEMLVSLRCNEFDQQIAIALAQKRQCFDGTTSAKVPAESIKKAGATGHEVQQDSVSVTVNEQRRLDSAGASSGKTEALKNQIMQAQGKDCILRNHLEEAAVAKTHIHEPNPPNLTTLKMLERSKPKVVESIEGRTEPYPPAPIAESWPTTPTVPYRLPASPLNPAPRTREFRDQLQQLATIYPDEVDHSTSMSPAMAKKSGLQLDRQP